MRKFLAPDDPLTREKSAQFIRPNEPLKNERVAELIDLKLEEARQIPDAELRRSMVNAWSMIKFQNSREAFDNQAEQEFICRFQGWLLGQGHPDDHARTPWGRRPLTALDDVSDYVSALSDAMIDYKHKLTKLRMRPPSDVNSAYLYYKYVVRGSKDAQQFLKDFQALNAGHVPGVPPDQSDRIMDSLRRRGQRGLDNTYRRGDGGDDDDGGGGGGGDPTAHPDIRNHDADTFSERRPGYGDAVTRRSYNMNDVFDRQNLETHTELAMTAARRSAIEEDLVPDPGQITDSTRRARTSATLKSRTPSRMLTVDDCAAVEEGEPENQGGLWGRLLGPRRRPLTNELRETIDARAPQDPRVNATMNEEGVIREQEAVEELHPEGAPPNPFAAAANVAELQAVANQLQAQQENQEAIQQQMENIVDLVQELQQAGPGAEGPLQPEIAPEFIEEIQQQMQQQFQQHADTLGEIRAQIIEQGGFAGAETQAQIDAEALEEIRQQRESLAKQREDVVRLVENLQTITGNEEDRRLAQEALDAQRAVLEATQAQVEERAKEIEDAAIKRAQQQEIRAREQELELNRIKKSARKSEQTQVEMVQTMRGIQETLDNTQKQLGAILSIQNDPQIAETQRRTLLNAFQAGFERTEQSLASQFDVLRSEVRERARNLQDIQIGVAQESVQRLTAVTNTVGQQLAADVEVATQRAEEDRLQLAMKSREFQVELQQELKDRQGNLAEFLIESRRKILQGQTGLAALGNTQAQLAAAERQHALAQSTFQNSMLSSQQGELARGIVAGVTRLQEGQAGISALAGARQQELLANIEVASEESTRQNEILAARQRGLAQMNLAIAQRLDNGQRAVQMNQNVTEQILASMGVDAARQREALGQMLVQSSEQRADATRFIVQGQQTLTEQILKGTAQGMIGLHQMVRTNAQELLAGQEVNAEQREIAERAIASLIAASMTESEKQRRLLAFGIKGTALIANAGLEQLRDGQTGLAAVLRTGQQELGAQMDILADMVIDPMTDVGPDRGDRAGDGGVGPVIPRQGQDVPRQGRLRILDITDDGDI